MIEAVIFDWAGTTIDYGCMAPVASFRQAFEAYKVNVNDDEIREPMGMLKVDHIKTMLTMPRIQETFNAIYGRSPEERDVLAIYKVFEQSLMANIERYTELKPEVLEVVKALRQAHIKIGSTTGYTDEMMVPVLARAKAQGYLPDAWFSPDATGGKGRPYPFMIFKNMEVLDIQDVRQIIKVGDTISDIREGKQAGIYSVGVLEGSSLMGLSQSAYEALGEEEQSKLLRSTKTKFMQAGADACIKSLQELIPLVTYYNTI